MTAPMIAASMLISALTALYAAAYFKGPPHVKRTVKFDVGLLVAWVALMVWGGFFNVQ